MRHDELRKKVFKRRRWQHQAYNREVCGTYRQVLEIISELEKRGENEGWYTVSRAVADTLEITKAGADRILTNLENLGVIDYNWRDSLLTLTAQGKLMMQPSLKEFTKQSCSQDD